MSKISTAAFQAAMEVAQSTQVSKLREPEFKLYGKSSKKMRALMNLLGSKAQAYIEFGVGYGSTLLATMCHNKHLKATAIENYYYDDIEKEQYNPDGWNNMKVTYTNMMDKYINGTDKAVIKSNIKFIEEDFKKVNYIGLPKHDLCLFDIQPVTEENFDFFFSEAIKSLHLDAVVIFTGISEITTANLLSNYIKKHINVEKEYIHTSQSTFDDTQFYSGIWAIKMKNYVCANQPKKTGKKNVEKKRNKSN